MNSTALKTFPQTTTRLALLAAALFAALVLFSSLIHTTLGSNILGADYYTFWVAGKALFLEGNSPYSQEVTQQAQLGIMGRLAEPGEDQLAYAYPLYGLLVLLPLVFTTFDWAMSYWLAFNILLLLTVLFFVLPPRARGFSVTILLMFPVFINLILGTFDILISSGILIFFGLIAGQGRRSTPIQVIAGLLLAWGTVKPQFIWLVLGFSLIYAIRERLFTFLIAFFGSLAFLLGGSFLLVPGWLIAWINRVQDYAGYVKSLPTLAEYFQLVMPLEAALALTGLVFVLCIGTSLILLLRWWKGELHWLKMLAWLSMLTYLFHLHGTAYDQIIFLLPLLLWAAEKDTWKRKEVLGFWLATMIFSWFAFALGVGTLVLDRSPVFLNALWVAWLYSKPRFQL